MTLKPTWTFLLLQNWKYKVGYRSCLDLLYWSASLLSQLGPVAYSQPSMYWFNQTKSAVNPNRSVGESILHFQAPSVILWLCLICSKSSLNLLKTCKHTDPCFIQNIDKTINTTFISLLWLIHGALSYVLLNHKGIDGNLCIDASTMAERMLHHLHTLYVIS